MGCLEVPKYILQFTDMYTLMFVKGHFSFFLARQVSHGISVDF